MMKPVSSLPLPQYTRKLPSMTTEISHKRCDRSIICIWGEVWDLFITLVLYQSIRKIHILIENIQRENQRLIKFPATQMYKR